jgi:hypothetical protein
MENFEFQEYDPTRVVHDIKASIAFATDFTMPIIERKN